MQIACMSLKTSNPKTEFNHHNNRKVIYHENIIKKDTVYSTL
jgi:hypothetical protein